MQTAGPSGLPLRAVSSPSPEAIKLEPDRQVLAKALDPLRGRGPAQCPAVPGTTLLLTRHFLPTSFWGLGEHRRAQAGRGARVCHSIPVTPSPLF